MPAKAAWETHEDGQQDDVRQRLEGVLELGHGPIPLDRLKQSAKAQASEGCDPMKSGVVELGLLLPEADYETLKGYARSLTVSYGKVRRVKRK